MSITPLTDTRHHFSIPFRIHHTVGEPTYSFNLEQTFAKIRGGGGRKKSVEQRRRRRSEEEAELFETLSKTNYPRRYTGHYC